MTVNTVLFYPHTIKFIQPTFHPFTKYVLNVYKKSCKISTTYLSLLPPRYVYLICLTAARKYNFVVSKNQKMRLDLLFLFYLSNSCSRTTSEGVMFISNCLRTRHISNGKGSLASTSTAV